MRSIPIGGPEKFPYFEFGQDREGRTGNCDEFEELAPNAKVWELPEGPRSKSCAKNPAGWFPARPGSRSKIFGGLVKFARVASGSFS